MNITTTHIVAAVVACVAIPAVWSRLNPPDEPSHRVSEVRRRDNVQETLDLIEKGRGK